jgi:hypothetical protein
MYRNFLNTYRETIPSGLPARLVDPTLRVLGEQPQFLRIGEGDHPTNELLRKVYQQPSKYEVRTKVLGDMFARDETNPYFNRPDNIAAIRSASEELGIPLERTGLRIATNPFRLEGDVADVNLLAQVTNKAAGNLKRSGKPIVANALTRKAQFFAQPTSHSEIAVDGTEGVEAILEAYNQAEPRRTANSQGNRPILVQADGLDPNIGIPSGSPENIPWDNVEGMRGSNAYKPADELKRPRFIDLGTGIFTRQGEPINADQQNLLDTGMADLEDRSFILRDPATARLEQLNRPKRIATIEGAMGTDSIWQNNNAQYRPSSRLGMEVLGAEMVGNTFLKGRDRQGTKLEISPVVEIKNLWGTDIPIEDPNRKSVELIRATIPGEKKYIETRIPINRLTDDLSNRLLNGEVDLRNYEPFKSVNTPQYYLDQSKDFVGPIRAVKDTTYGATQGKTPWREYYSDPFVYEDKGLDGEVSRLVKAVNEAPAQLENALSDQALANRKVFDIEQKIAYVPSLNRIAKGSKKGDQSITASPEAIIDWVEARETIRPIVAPLQKERRMAEVEAAKAQDRIAELRAAQELMGVEYMVKPKLWGEDVLSGYASAARTRGAMKDGSYDELMPTTDSLSGWRQAISAIGNESANRRFDAQYLSRDRDYDIASLFGFSGNY